MNNMKDIVNNLDESIDKLDNTLQDSIKNDNDISAIDISRQWLDIKNNLIKYKDATDKERIAILLQINESYREIIQKQDNYIKFLVNNYNIMEWFDEYKKVIQVSNSMKQGKIGHNKKVSDELLIDLWFNEHKNIQAIQKVLSNKYNIEMSWAALDKRYKKLFLKK